MGKQIPERLLEKLRKLNATRSNGATPEERENAREQLLKKLKEHGYDLHDVDAGLLVNKDFAQSSAEAPIHSATNRPMFLMFRAPLI